MANLITITINGIPVEVEKGKTAKYLREKREVSPVVKENLKKFNQMKKLLIFPLKLNYCDIIRTQESPRF
jgi:hypothetical protein